MRIFKKEFDECLVDGMSIGECIITKINNSEYGRFIVHQKTGKGSFPYMGLFPLLEDAIKYVQTLETPDSKYEYYCQYEKNTEEGWDRAHLETMGVLGWELCAIDTNVTDDTGRSFYIYKRIINYNPYDIKHEEHDNSEIWQASKKSLELRNTIGSTVSDYTFSDEDKYTKSTTVHFGKNGLGLTNELSIIGKKIEEFSKENLVYLKECFIDSCDDVYNLTFTLKPIQLCQN